MLLVNDKWTSERCPHHHHSSLWMLVNSGKRAVPVSTHQVMNEELCRQRVGAVAATEHTVCDSVFMKSSLVVIWPVH